MEITQFLFNKFYLGFSIGFLGAFHCVGMCGPLIWSLPIHKMSLFNRNLYFATYHIVRILSYVLLGILVGIFQAWLPFQHIFSILSILVGLVFMLNLFSVSIPFLGKANQRFSLFIAKKTSYFFSQKKTLYSFFMLGFFNGLLPCGLVYTALASTLTQTNWADSAYLMLAFGLATFPVMFAVSIFGNWITDRIRTRYQFLTKIVILIISLLLIYRGVLGLMPTSKTAPNKPVIMDCH